MAISAGVSVVGTLYKGQMEKEQADAQAREAQIQAAQTEAAAVEEAKRIRKAGDRQAGAARAALAASGVNVNEGTAVTIEDDITSRTEDDAMQTLLTGQRRSSAGFRQASMIQKRGDAAQTASFLEAGATAARGWKAVNDAGGLKFGMTDSLTNFYQRGTRGVGD